MAVRIYGVTYLVRETYGESLKVRLQSDSKAADVYNTPAARPSTDGKPMNDRDSESDIVKRVERDRLAADRLRTLRRPDLISADGKLWWNAPNWEPIGLSLNYEIGPPMSTEHHHRHGIERMPLPWNFPTKEQLLRAKAQAADAELQRRNQEAFDRAFGPAARQANEERRRQLAQMPAPTLQEAKRLIEAERRQRIAQESEPTSMPEAELLTNKSEPEDGSAEATPNSDVVPDSTGQWD